MAGLGNMDLAAMSAMKGAPTLPGAGTGGKPRPKFKERKKKSR
jgi:hypothetical protein